MAAFHPAVSAELRLDGQIGSWGHPWPLPSPSISRWTETFNASWLAEVDLLTSVCFLDGLDWHTWETPQVTWRHLRGRRARPPRAAREDKPNFRCPQRQSWSCGLTPCWWEECGICWKCASPQNRLITEAGTQCRHRNTQKRAFMLQLTAALCSMCVLVLATYWVPKKWGHFGKAGTFFWPGHRQGLMVKIWFGLVRGQGVRWDW